MKKNIINTCVLCSFLFTSAFATDVYTYKDFSITNKYTSFMTINYDPLTRTNICDTIFWINGDEATQIYIGYDRTIDFQVMLSISDHFGCKQQINYIDDQHNVIAQTYYGLTQEGTPYYTPFDSFANDLKIEYKSAGSQTKATFVKIK